MTGLASGNPFGMAITDMAGVQRMTKVWRRPALPANAMPQALRFVHKIERIVQLVITVAMDCRTLRSIQR